MSSLSFNISGFTLTWTASGLRYTPVGVVSEIDTPTMR